MQTLREYAGTRLSKSKRFGVWGLEWASHPIIVTIRDNAEYSRVLLYSY